MRGRYKANMKISVKTSMWDMNDIFLWKEKYKDAYYKAAMLGIVNVGVGIMINNYFLLIWNIIITAIYILPTISFNKWRRDKYGKQEKR